MAYSGQFLKLTWGFIVRNSDEIADTSICYTTAPGWTGAELALAELQTTTLADIRSAYNSFMVAVTDSNGYWADFSQLKSIKVAAVGTDGHYLTEPVVAETDTPPGGTGGNLVPQSTVVLSLRSGFTIGGGNYGRMFLPHTVLRMQSQFPQSTTAVAGNYATAAKNFINNVTALINADTTAVLFPAIMSQGSGAGVSPSRPPSGKGVTAVGIGTVTDTQRRRRNSLAEQTVLRTLA